MNRRIPFLALAFLVLVLAGAPQARTLKVVAGTSLIEDIVRDLTDGQAEMITLIPGSSCPGHDNVKTVDFVFAAKADMVLAHAFQRNMPQLVGMMDSVKNNKLRLEIMETRGSWLVPEVQKNAVREIAAALSVTSPEQAQSIGKRAERRLARVDQAENESLIALTALKDKTVVAADMQSEFVRWTGLRVLNTYRRSEEMTPGDVAKLVDTLRGRVIAGVIDNSQSGADTGLPLALELKVPHVVLSNFPGSTEDVPDYFSLLRHNVSQLALLGE